jgi:hypothetical protein
VAQFHSKCNHYESICSREIPAKQNEAKTLGHKNVKKMKKVFNFVTKRSKSSTRDPSQDGSTLGGSSLGRSSVISSGASSGFQAQFGSDPKTRGSGSRHQFYKTCFVANDPRA